MMSRTFTPALSINYGQRIESRISELEVLIQGNPELTDRFQARWLALKLLQKDDNITAKVRKTANTQALLSAAEEKAAELSSQYDDDLDSIITDRRYSWIHDHVQQVLIQAENTEASLSDKLDRIFTNRILGLPIFLAMMWVVFKNHHRCSFSLPGLGGWSHRRSHLQLGGGASEPGEPGGNLD